MHAFIPSDVPQSEANALIWLYDHSDGDSWNDNTGWKSDPIVGNWFGITVAGGHVTRLNINTNSCSGNIGAWAVNDLASLTHLYLNNNSFSGDLSGWTLPASLTHLYLRDNSFSGDLSGWTLPASLAYLYLNDNLFSGDLSGWTLPASLARLYLHNNSFSGAADISSNIAMRSYLYHSNALVQADVDAVSQSVYNRRMAFTYATPSLNIGGTNAAPSGIYQAACPPGTGKEYVFELENDSCGDGFNKWTITFTP